MEDKDYTLDVNGVAVHFRHKIGMKAFAALPAIIAKVAGGSGSASVEDVVTFVQAVVEHWDFPVPLRAGPDADRRAERKIVDDLIAFFDARENGELEFFAVVNRGLALFSERLEAVQATTPK